MERGSEEAGTSKNGEPVRVPFKSSSAPSLYFPRPHRLGLSTGLRPSKSSRGYLGLLHSPDAAFSQSATPLQVELLTESSSKPAPPGEDQTDYSAPPPLKKTKLSITPDVCAPLKPVVKTHNDAPLCDVALFLPPRLPKSILQSQFALSEFVIATAVTYLSLWDITDNLKTLNLQFPIEYVDKLSEDTEFLNIFIFKVLNQISNVKSIEEFILPNIVLDSKTDLVKILQPIVDSKCSISSLCMPVTSSLTSPDLQPFDLKAIATLLCKTRIEKVTFISSDDVVKEFSSKLLAEAECLKRKHIAVSCSDRELGIPGPGYIANLGEALATGEAIDPSSLVMSLNVVPGKTGAIFTAKSLHKATKKKKKAHGAFSTDCTYADEAELNESSPFVSYIWNLDSLHERGTTGTGTTIAVIDSGISYMHPAFKGKIVAVKNFVQEEIDDIDCAIDSDGHGTHCAGIAAGNSHFCPVDMDEANTNCIRVPPGVAPGSKLVICKVVKTSNGEVDSNAFFASLIWLKDQHLKGVQKIDVVTISLASTYFSNKRAQVISDLTRLGVIVVCCASNVGRLRLQPIAFPARLGHVLCIGAHDENGKPTSFSPVGRELDFLAPGADLWGPGPGTVGPFAMDCASGTSCATPAVAGLVCLILQAVKDISDSNPGEYQIGGKLLIDHIRNVWVMREILKEMSSSPGHHSEEIGYGTLNPYRILDRSDEEVMRTINEIIEDE